MNNHWMLVSDSESLEKVDSLMNMDAENFRVTYRKDGKSSIEPRRRAFYGPNSLDGSGSLREEYRFHDFEIELVLNCSSFEFDIFFQDGIFVSKKFRESMNLGDAEVHYSEVHVVSNNKNILLSEYMHLRVVACRELVDVEKSIGVNKFDPHIDYRPNSSRSIIFLENSEFDVSIFFDRYTGINFVSDAFAQKFIDANLIGAEFQDPVAFNSIDHGGKIEFKLRELR